MLEPRLRKHIDLLVERYSSLKSIEQQIIDAYLVMERCYLNGGKLLLAGNGGSAADCEHIAGELMKRFKLPRHVPTDMAEKLCRSIRSVVCFYPKIWSAHLWQSPW